MPTLAPILIPAPIPTPALIPAPAPIPTLAPIPPSLQQAPASATLHPVSAVNWERIKKFRSILQAECMETCSRYKERWFQIGLAIEGNNIGVCKACIKDANSLKDLTISLLLLRSEYKRR